LDYVVIVTHEDAVERRVFCVDLAIDHNAQIGYRQLFDNLLRVRK